MSTPTPPTLESFAQQLYDSMESMQWAEADLSVGFALAYFCGSIGTMFQILENYGRDETDENGKDAPGWSQLVDIERTPDEALPWFGQFTGARFPPGLTADQQRAYIVNAPQWRRGTLRSFQDVASIYLTGNQTLIIKERYDPANPTVDSPGHLTIYTYAPETPNPTAVQNALMSVKPAGIILHYQSLTGQLYSTVKANYATYTAVKTKYATYDDMRQAPP
jgi:hypothetical protein